MVFSSIAVADAVAMAAVRRPKTVNLDAISAFTITSVGVLIAAPMFVWSKNLRETRVSSIWVAFLWIGLMAVGVVASIASMKALPSLIPCDTLTKLGACDLVCNVTLPMRGKQLVMSIPFSARIFYSPGWFAGGALPFTAVALIFASFQGSPTKGPMRHATISVSPFGADIHQPVEFWLSTRYSLVLAC